LTGFSAAGHLLKIEEDARTRVTNTVGTVENWARAIAERQDGGTELEREIDIVRHSYCRVEAAADRQGSFQLETLMDSHIDKAFDKFTAWTLRNAFDFQKDLELVLVSSTLCGG
jgi:kinetochore protein Mis12/MTW1